MKFLKYISLFSIAFSCLGAAQAHSIYYWVPFHNLEVKAASKLYAMYSFDSHRHTLVCTSAQSNDAITSIEWTYKDATRKIELPVTLKDGFGYEGHLADPWGNLVITNDFGSSSKDGSIFVTCEFRNMN